MSVLQNWMPFVLMIFLGANVLAQNPENNLPQEPITTENNLPEIMVEDVETPFEFDWDAKPLVTDGAYERKIHKERVALPLPHIREADVMWTKRIWRTIDFDEKMNLVFKNENQPFMEILMKIIYENPDVVLYADEKFTEVLPKSSLTERMSGTDTIAVYDIELEDYVFETVTNDFNPTEFSEIRIKEDWIFETRHTKMTPRIVAFAPVRNVIDENTGAIRGQEALFWVNFDNIRPYLANLKLLIIIMMP